MGKLTPYVASLVLGAVALLYVVLTALHFRRHGTLDLKHKTWLRIAIMLTAIAIAMAVLNTCMG